MSYQVLSKFVPVCVLLLASAIAGHAQTDAQVVLAQGDVTAGDSITVNVSLEAPATCDTQVNVRFLSADRNTTFIVGGPVHAGDTTAVLKSEIMRDVPGGEYHSDSAYFNPCPGYGNIKPFSIPSKIVTLRAFADTNKYPATADVALSFTQKQFFDTKIAQLDNLDSRITTALENNSADTPQLRAFLANMATSADEALSVTEQEYREQIMKSQGQLPAFFADFHAQYQALLIDLKAPIPGGGPQANLNRTTTLLYVQFQLKKRVPSDQGTKNMSATYPPTVTVTRDIIRDNKSAYKRAKDGRITFSVRLASYPTHARISYKKLTDNDYTDFSKPTDVDSATFELATWMFKFHRDECSDEPVRRINPYQDTDPEISVEFSNCKGSR